MTVAIMGCVVNGPGEAREADIGIAGGKGQGILFKKGEIVRKIPADKLVEDHMTENGVEVACADGWTNEELMEYITKNNIVCPKCGKMNYTDIRKL